MCSLSTVEDRQELIARLRGIAAELSTRSVPRHEFLRRTGVSERAGQRLFGSYNGLVEAAGLEPRIFPTSDAPSYSDTELLDEVVRVLRLSGAKLTRILFDQNAAVSSSACERRFGDWISTLRAAAERLHPTTDSALLQRLHEYTGAAPEDAVSSHSAVAIETQFHTNSQPRGGSPEDRP